MASVSEVEATGVATHGAGAGGGDHLKLRTLLFGMAPAVYGRPDESLTLPEWPPDVFALVGSAAEITGCYVRWVSSMTRSQWESRPRHIARLGKAWRRRFNGVDVTKLKQRDRRQHETALEELERAWVTLKNNDDVALIDLAEGNKDLRMAMYVLFAAADEACEGVGRAKMAQGGNDPMLFRADHLLTVGKDHENYERIGSSLCSPDVTHATMRVLPKHLTPQGGLTLRSLSRNLALCASTSVKSYWYGFAASTRPRRRSLNLLVIPWPFVVRPLQFVPADPSGELVGETDSDRFFQYQIPIGDSTPTGEPVVKVFTEILKAAKEADGQIDGIVLPELAIADDVYPHLESIAKENECFLICGVGERPERGRNEAGSAGNGRQRGGKNELRCNFPFSHDFGHDLVSWSRSKHHRWRLDRSQIIQYGLGGRLHTQYNWWEHISLPDRRLGFFGAAPDFSLCALVCEDLAQQDPVGGLVRAAGPNLVVALLMDGPQLAERWSGRYASVLADDPGSSILTVTSLGMTKLSRPPGVSSSRVIALWKDAFSGAQPIELPRGDCACLLNLSLEEKAQRTADGRVGTGVYPVLGGVHFVRNVASLAGVDV